LSGVSQTNPSLRLSVTTPRGALVEADVLEVIAPGAKGEFDVLPEHVPFLSALNPGVLVYRAADGPHVLAVGTGVLEVARQPGDKGDKPDKVIVLVDQALTAGEIDAVAANKDLASADSELAGWKKDLDGEYQALLARRSWAVARVEAAGRAKAH
jgi:F-type H+-transporting ATPase subunit epsilon